MALNAMLPIAVVLYCCPCILGVPLAEFYPYGPGFGDDHLPPTDDDSSLPVKLPQPFLFFDKEHKTLFVRDFNYIYATLSIIVTVTSFWP